MNLMRSFSLGLALASALFLTGCLGYEEEMKINNDLSGTATIKILLPDVVDTKLSAVGDAFAEAALRKRIDAANGVTLLSYKLVSDTRRPELTVEIKFSSLAALSKAAEANPPAAMLLGKFVITTDEKGGKRITRTLGTAAPSEELKDDIYAQYVMHFAKALSYTNSTRFDGANDTIRFRYKLNTIVSARPEIIATIPKPNLLLWAAASFGSLAFLFFLVWQIYGQKKRVRR